MELSQNWVLEFCCAKSAFSLLETKILVAQIRTITHQFPVSLWEDFDRANLTISLAKRLRDILFLLLSFFSRFTNKNGPH